MTQDQWILIIAGGIIAVLGATGLMSRLTRRGRSLYRLLGEVGTRIFFTVLGILFVVLGFLNITG